MSALVNKYTSTHGTNLVEALCRSPRRLPGSYLHKGEVFRGDDPDRSQLSKAVERVKKILDPTYD